MKFGSFSDAIRAADGTVEQSFFGPGARDIFNVDAGKACAIEGGLRMMNAPILNGEDAIYHYTRNVFPYLAEHTTCHLCDDEKLADEIISIIWHLNDYHHLSFAQIADWLQSEEDKLGYATLSEPQQTIPTEAVCIG